MGQAGSTQQQQSDNQAGAAGTAANEQQRRTPGRTGLHYSRSQRNNGSKDGNTLSRFTSRDGENNNKKDAVSPTKPRRKSLDMPDMGLSMTSGGAGGGGGTGTPNSIQGTPTQLRTSIFPASRQHSSSMSTPTGSAQQSPKMSLRIQPGVEGTNTNSNGAEDGLPMAFAPMQQSHHAEPGTSSNPSITSPTLSNATMSPAGRWARHKDGVKEGFGKKAQPVIGEAAVLHAAGLSAEKASQNNNAPSLSTSPTVPQIPLSGSSMSSRASPSSSSSRARLGNMDTTQPSSSTRRFEAGDNNSLLSPLLPDDIHRQPPSAPGHALDPAQLASLLAPTHQKQHQQSQLRQSHDALPDHAHLHGTSSPTSSNTTVQQQQQHNNHLRISNTQQQQQQSDSIPSTPGASGAGHFSIPVPIPSPLKQPTETILAPELPADVPIVVPSYIPPDLSHAIITDSIGNPLPAMGSNASRTAQDVVSASSSNTAAAGADSVSSPLIPGSTPPLGNPPNTLPAAAPIAALNPTLSQDPKAQEAVKAATVDLGAGPDGVATLLTWKAEEETTGSSGLDGTGALKTKIPSQVFVTGTFAKGWSTKIELRRNQ
jgi:hypothetical protein